jgi:diacylglycerol kinase family enzyme
MPTKATHLRELAFLINPVSGDGVGRSVFKRLGEILDSFGMARETWTAELTDPERLAEQIDGFLQSSRKLIAVGGDGTLGTVLDRVRRLRPTTEIGLIPLGTGNDLARALGIYRIYSAKGLIACLKRLLKAQSHPFDLWDVGEEATLVSYLSAGLDAAILHSFDQARKQGRIRGGALGNKIYYACAFFAQLKNRLPAGSSARLETAQGTVELSLAGSRAILIANINSYAAGAHPFPENRFDDGQLEISVFDALWQYLLVAVGSRVAPPIARWIRHWLPRHAARRVSLSLVPGTPVQLDGEDFTDRGAGASPLTISLAARVHLLDLRRTFYALF